MTVGAIAPKSWFKLSSSPEATKAAEYMPLDAENAKYANDKYAVICNVCKQYQMINMLFYAMYANSMHNYANDVEICRIWRLHGVFESNE